MVNELRWLEAAFGETMYRMPSGGWRVRCVCCQQYFTMEETVVYNIRTTVSSQDFYDTLRADPGAICAECRATYGTMIGYFKSLDAVQREATRAERDGISPMIGAE